VNVDCDFDFEYGMEASWANVDLEGGWVMEVR